jgi:hypothetical protein
MKQKLKTGDEFDCLYRRKLLSSFKNSSKSRKVKKQLNKRSRKESKITAWMEINQNGVNKKVKGCTTRLDENIDFLVTKWAKKEITIEEIMDLIIKSVNNEI